MNIRPESRKKFEQQGVALTLYHLQLDNMEPTEKNEMVAWLGEEECKSKRRETMRFRLMLVFTIVAAVGSSIAAWPIVTGFLMK